VHNRDRSSGLLEFVERFVVFGSLGGSLWGDVSCLLKEEEQNKETRKRSNAGSRGVEWGDGSGAGKARSSSLRDRHQWCYCCSRSSMGH
jgi:hypothetical protein